MSDDELSQRDLQVLWHPCSQMRDYDDFLPLPVVGASGGWIELADGRRLFDGFSSWWCKSLGHSHPQLMTALQRQSERFDHVIQANTTNSEVVRLCERLLAIGNGEPAAVWGQERCPAPGPAASYGKVFLADSGSMAMEIAMKLALHAQQHLGRSDRTGFAALAAGYHGETIATLSVGDCGLYGDPYRSLMFPVTMLQSLPLRRGPDDPAWQDASAEWPAIEAQLDAVADRLAAICYEPVLQGAGGMRIYSPDLIRRLRSWADAHDVFLIADEIAAGMGRCGTMLAGEWAGDDVRPDFPVVSKGLTGGALPLSAVLVPQRIYELFLGDYFEFKAFMHSNTWTGNALAVAVANAALDVYAGEDILGQVAARGPDLRAGLQELASRFPGRLGNIRGVGMMAAADLLGCDRRERVGLQVYRAGIEEGLLLRNLGDSIYLFPPLNSSAEECTHLLSALGRALQRVLDGAAG